MVLMREPERARVIYKSQLLIDRILKGLFVSFSGCASAFRYFSTRHLEEFLNIVARLYRLLCTIYAYSYSKAVLTCSLKSRFSI